MIGLGDEGLMPRVADGHDLYWALLLPLDSGFAAKQDWVVLFSPLPRQDRS